MTYNVLGGMLNLALSIYPSQLLAGAAWGLGSRSFFVHGSW